MTQAAPNRNASLIPAPLKRWGRVVLDALLPPQCLSCEALVSDPGAVCPTCWEGVTHLGTPACACCGLPFEFDAGAGTLCAGCLAQAPNFARARSAVAYDDATRSMILAFKHADRTDAAPGFAAWMARAGADLLADADVLVPVPLHWTRLFSRRFNQSALLAQALSARSGVAIDPVALKRARRTPSQGHLSPTARRRNVAGAFQVPAPDTVAGKRVLLIDDVYTTGATANACARALKKGGATAVDVLTLARALRTSPD